MDLQTKSYTPNFCSNIRFVNTTRFNAQDFGKLLFSAGGEMPLKQSMVRATNPWTLTIRSCTAGGVVDKDGVTAFHFFHSKNNFDNLSDHFISTLQSFSEETPMSALIIGSKDLDMCKHSIPVFDKVTEKIRELVRPSIFKTYADKFAQSDIGYERATDTWYICTEFPNRKRARMSSISSIKELISKFREIQIAPQDRLFIGQKEILREDYPDLFAK